MDVKGLLGGCNFRPFGVQNQSESESESDHLTSDFFSKLTLTLILAPSDFL